MNYRAARGVWLWLGLFAVTVAMARLVGPLPVPGWMQIDMAGAVSRFMDWLVNTATFGLFTFKDLTRAIAQAIEWPYQAVRMALVDGWVEGRRSDAHTILPPLSWLAIIAIVTAMGIHARSWRLGLFVGLCFAYLAVFGQWESSMVTLASILIAVPLGVVGGLILGIAAAVWPWFDRWQTPWLDLMQTVPTFAYLVPILFLFGFGPVSALIATVIYAMPPMVRITTLSLRAVPSDIRDFGVMSGCTPAQRLTRVLLPTALPDLMVGVNQVIMLSLNMVIIASMIGAGGLGFDVLNSLRRLDIGRGVEAGLAIVALAIALDRLSQAFARQSQERGVSGMRHHRWWVVLIAFVVVTTLLGYVVPGFRAYPEDWTITTRVFWSDLVKWINVNYYDQLEALKDALLLNLLLPVKRFLLALPWPWVLALLALAGWQLGRGRLALLCVALGMFIVVNGLWEPAMTTLYLCGISVVIATLIGLPVGVWAASSDRAGRFVGAGIDLLQTLPSFVYLIPVVMLFRVGDFSAMIAIVLYALAPAIRYTAHGLRSVPEEIVEAGAVCGCTRWQILTRIRMPMALPEIMLGLNQTIMLALSMLVITALVGTRDLGQEVYIALTRADTGQGLVAGVSIAAIAIIADRLIAAGARRTRRRMGMEPAHP